MDRSIFAFIWRHSKAQQIVLLGVTVLSFPFLYASLELPKRIINDAIDGEPGPRALFGLEVGQVELLAILCAGFLAAVLAQGLMKMQINTMKGVLAERLLRRFRYQLIDRILRFPQSHARRTSQGELVSMVTAETEPMAGIMGDLVAQPVFQGGMMLTILGFLFVQNPFLGLAAIALIPLQGWLIPRLQRQINLLNKERVREVRALAQQIGESAAGAADLRLNYGWRHRLAQVSERLGRLFEIRYRIYRKKFFMKFLNNFITQLTPFFFYAIGGYLAIQGELTVGALVAAIAAYKDLAGPWKELLTWYNQTQDMGLRWRVVIERFVPQGLIDERLFHERPAERPSLAGPIVLEDVSVRESDGSCVLAGISATIEPGSMVAVATRSANERRALAELLLREVVPATGRISIAGHPLNSLHQATIADRMGYASTRPYLFAGTVGSNLTMALQCMPQGVATLPAEVREALDEAARTGNSTDPADGAWLDPTLAGVPDRSALLDWWMALVEAMGTDVYLFERGLDARFDPETHPELASRLIELRPRIAERIAAKGLGPAMHRFEEARFNPGLPMAGNLLFATPTREIKQEELAGDERFICSIRELGLEGSLLGLGKAVLSVLVRVFGGVPDDHPLFFDLGIDGALYARLAAIQAKAAQQGVEALDAGERRLLMTVPFRFSADQIGEAFPDTLRDKALSLRGARMAELRRVAADVFEPIEPTRIARGLTVLENAIFGKMAYRSGAKGEKLRRVVATILEEEGLKPLVAELIYDVESSIGGANLPQAAHERIAFVRAAIKRPDILILNEALASHERDARLTMRRRLRALLPKTTLIFLEEDFVQRDSFDQVLEIEDGRIVSGNGQEDLYEDPAAAALSKKIRLLEKSEPFTGLDRRQLRLLAFGAQWVSADTGDYLYYAGDAPDGAYLLAQGSAELRWPTSAPEDPAVSEVLPGRVVGDLSVLRGEPRRLDMVATAPTKALRIDAAVLLKVIEHDAQVAVSLLRTVSGYLIEVGARLRDANAVEPIPASPPALTDST
ncbi:MAG: ABC transporter transmembrane domain-containing protein [Pseudomonadota bacterium]